MTKQKNSSILAILMMGTFLCNINQTLLNIALPSIMKAFSISASQGQWLSTGYMLVSGLMIPITAYMIERFKTRPLYIFSITMFLIGSLLAGIAPNFFLLVIGRMVQAIGAGIIMPLMTVTLMNIYPAHKIGSIMGLVGIAMNFAPGVGPAFAGWVLQHYTWRTLFYAIVPFAALNLILAIIYLTNVGQQKFLKFNATGVLLSSIGLGSLLYGFSNAGDHPWLSFKVIGIILIGLLVTAGFIWQQLAQERPMLNFFVFKSPTFTIMTIINFIIIMALYGGMLLLPLFVQNVRGASPLISGLIMLPGAFFMAVLSPISGKFFDRYGVKPVSIIGITILLAGTFMFILLDGSTSIAFVTVAQTIRSIGLVLILMPLQAQALKALPIDIVAHGTAMFQTSRQIAGSIGTAILITIMSHSSARYEKATYSEHLSNPQQQDVLLHGLQSAYITTTLLCLLALILIFRLKPVVPLDAKVFRK